MPMDLAAYVARMTERLLVDAGIGPGMSVLDAGCGRGDVSFLLARLVGETGRVLGLDRDPEALAQARKRAEELGLANVDFVAGDINSISLGESFDAVAGRRVLMYQPDPAHTLGRLAQALRGGGRMIFQEHDSTVSGGLSPLPLHERVQAWVWRTVEREGGDLHMGFHLAAALAKAGLDVEHVRAEAVVQTPGTRYVTGAIIRAMLPRILRLGVATEAEIDVDTLDDRLDAERSQAQATYIGELVFGAWARKP